MYVERVPNRGARPTVLLRESFREGCRVRERALANRTRWPPRQIEALRAVLAGATHLGKFGDAFEFVRTSFVTRIEPSTSRPSHQIFVINRRHGRVA
jgi:hypothetical protein